MLEDRDLFVHIRPDGGNYSGAAHLAEMIALLGPPPKSMVDEAIEENEKREWRWNAKAQNAQGKLCDHPVDYWGGPFFDAEGMHEFLRICLLLLFKCSKHRLTKEIQGTSFTSISYQKICNWKTRCLRSKQRKEPRSLPLHARCYSGHPKTGRLPKNCSMIHSSSMR